MNYELQPNLYRSVSDSYLKSEDEGTMPKHRQILSQEDIQEMFQAQNRMISFMEGIGEIKDTVIRTDVIEHCDRTKLNLNEYFSIENIEKMVKNRIEKMIKNKRIKKNWSQEDVKILTWIVSKYSDFKGISYIQRDLNIEDWKYIASLIPGVQAESCMFKWLSLKKNNLTEHGWGDRQSQLLEKVVKKFGERDWSLISQKLYFMNTNPHKIYRCAKQCRQHWNCYLNPNLKKGPWTKEEDLLLLTIIKKNKCQKRWAQMVSEFKGRTQNALKNRFTLIMQKEAKLHPKSQKLTQLEIIEEFLEKSYVQQFVDDTKKDEKVSEERMRTRRRQAIQQAENVFSSANVSVKIEEGDKVLMKNVEEQKMNEEAVEEEELPSLENISIVTLSSQQLKELTQIILAQKSDYVPCTFDNNKLKKISKM